MALLPPAFALNFQRLNNFHVCNLGFKSWRSNNTYNNTTAQTYRTYRHAVVPATMDVEGTILHAMTTPSPAMRPGASSLHCCGCHRPSACFPGLRHCFSAGGCGLLAFSTSSGVSRTKALDHGKIVSSWRSSHPLLRHGPSASFQELESKGLAKGMKLETTPFQKMDSIAPDLRLQCIPTAGYIAPEYHTIPEVEFHSC